jgi:hypothetical protein
MRSGVSGTGDHVKAELDDWLRKPSLRVAHRRRSSASAEELWSAASSIRLCDTPVLGRLVQWRIPDLERDQTYDRLFREPPFMVLAEHDQALISGLVGRIWTLRRDYPRLADRDEFREWSHTGTARVAIATWVQADDRGSTLFTEARVEAIGAQGQLGMAAVRPLVRAFEHLVSTEALRTAVRQAERSTARSGG